MVSNPHKYRCETEALKTTVSGPLEDDIKVEETA